MTTKMEARGALESGGSTYVTQADGSHAFQWLRMAITAADPKHVWHAGKGYDADAFDGFTAHTDDHVWLEARGGGTTPDGGGTITIQSEGQSWLQSMEGGLSVVAKGNVVFGTGTHAKSGFKLGAAGGLTIVADHRIAASSVPIGSPGDALTCETSTADTAGAWGIWWTTLDTACALGLNVLDRTMAKALTGSARPTGIMNTLMLGVGMGANFAGAGANLYGMIAGAAGGPTAPGMTLAGEAGVLIGSKIAVNIWGLPGALLSSAFSTVFGGVSTTALAGVDFGMSSLGTVDMSSLVQATVSAVSLTTAVGVELASRKGVFTADAKTNLTIQSPAGRVEGHATTTAKVTSAAWLDLVAAKGSVGLKSNGTLAIEATVGHTMGLLPPGADPGGGKPDEVTALAPVDDLLVTPPEPGAGQPMIAMTAAGGVKILSGVEASAPLVTIKADKIELAVGAGAAVLVDATQAKLGVRASTITVSAQSVKIAGPKVSFA